MFLGADELVTPGGPSAPAWAFFTAITLAIIGVLAQQLKAHSDLKQLKAQAETIQHEASKANESAIQARENTVNLSNGFVSRMDRKLDSIQATANETSEALRDHLAWHLEKEGK
jgi:hypothetical protein